MEREGQAGGVFAGGGLLLEIKEQWATLKGLPGESWPPELEAFFSDSDVREQRNVVALERALARAQIQEASRKIRAKLDDTPGQTVKATVAAMGLVAESQAKFDRRVIYPSQDALHRAFSNIRKRLKVEGHGNPVHSAAFSPKGNQIVSGSSDGTLRLWRGGTGKTGCGTAARCYCIIRR